METLTLTDISTQCFSKTRGFGFTSNRIRQEMATRSAVINNCKNDKARLIFMGKCKSECRDGLMRLTSPSIIKVENYFDEKLTQSTARIFRSGEHQGDVD